ncbi:anaerobic ribonucleoside-triphosphate reductase [Desulfovibrio sp. An276]|uniref:anaerobic ribonucleoside triphosphate reductase n=1 Tax=Desulfovibrio sp. An276 TaxID=1965618 RepID=UPI000B39EE16|nr:anaerobic ribonucleoside triphosphate reductase [Desulfovibrio sp. An276]OUO52025.1 anaerobic ribonucleoside-triphosphate reductase [Desulfovibrio sp. An276]
MQVYKRDGSVDEFDSNKIANSISSLVNPDNINTITADIINDMNVGKDITTSEISNIVMAHLDKVAADKYAEERLSRDAEREKQGYIFNRLRTLTNIDASQDTGMRENGNINADSTMGLMLKIGSDVMKHYYLSEVLSPEASKAHRDGVTHEHDLDFYGTAANCLQINLEKLFENGFSTGHGSIRTPQSIRNYWSLLCIVIQANQNDMFGGQSIPALEYYLAPGVSKSFARILADTIIESMGARDKYGMHHARRFRDAAMERIYPKCGKTLMSNEAIKELCSLCEEFYGVKPTKQQVNSAIIQVTDECMQGAEACIHNLCTMASRAGAQVPFSSVNYGMGTSIEQRMVIACMLQALDNGLGNGETQIFPIHVFLVKDGVNYKPGDPNYDLFRKAIAVTAHRMFPNYEFLDSPFNLQYYKEGEPDTYVCTMGCRTRVMGNVNGPETTSMRGNLSFITVNLPHLALESEGNIDTFFKKLDDTIDLCIEELLFRFRIQASRHVYNYPMLFGNKMYMGSEDLKDDSTLFDAYKHGTLTTGFVGLAECLVALIGKHHGESAEAQELGLRIIGHMRERMDQATEKHHLNFSLIGSPAESTASSLLRKDRERFGVIPGVTDREYYTNSSHCPVWYNISAKDKLAIEAPYHALENGGHIAYVEFDGDPTQNLEAVERIVRWMHDFNIGYGAINRAIDTCTVCGHTGIINDMCPKCGNSDEGKIQRLRRITGYLVGDRNKRFNDGKLAEERDRVKHKI